jgi:hypothetical protein
MQELNSNYSNKNMSTTLLMMTFREYYAVFVGIKEPPITNGWGWFVDLELNSEPIKITNSHFNRYKPLKYISVLNTIKEYPSIRSMKSITNLNDVSMKFEMDKDFNKNITNNITLCIITVGTIVIAAIIYYFK